MQALRKALLLRGPPSLTHCRVKCSNHRVQWKTDTFSNDNKQASTNLTPKHESICLGVGVGRPSISCGCAIAID